MLTDIRTEGEGRGPGTSTTNINKTEGHTRTRENPLKKRVSRNTPEAERERRKGNGKVEGDDDGGWWKQGAVRDTQHIKAALRHWRAWQAKTENDLPLSKAGSHPPSSTCLPAAMRKKRQEERAKEDEEKAGNMPTNTPNKTCSE